MISLPFVITKKITCLHDVCKLNVSDFQTFHCQLRLCKCVWDTFIPMMHVERNELLILGWYTDPDTSTQRSTHIHTYSLTMPHPIKASQYAVQ